MSQRKWVNLTFVVFLFAAVLACNYIAPTQPPPSAFATENPHTDIPRVPLEEAKAAFDNGTAIFVDVRGSAAYEDSHIPGALSIPANELTDRMDELDPDQWIITYCT